MNHFDLNSCIMIGRHLEQKFCPPTRFHLTDDSFVGPPIHQFNLKFLGFSIHLKIDISTIIYRTPNPSEMLVIHHLGAIVRWLHRNSFNKDVVSQRFPLSRTCRYDIFSYIYTHAGIDLDLCDVHDVYIYIFMCMCMYMCMHMRIYIYRYTYAYMTAPF